MKDFILAQFEDELKRLHIKNFLFVKIILTMNNNEFYFQKKKNKIHNL